MTIEETEAYIEALNSSYYKTKLNCALDGYTGSKIVHAFGSQYELNQLASYNQILWLLQGLDVKSIFDLGCGAGSLVNYLMKCSDIVPYGIDANPLAIKVLKEVVLPDYKENFAVRNFLTDNIVVSQDVCHIMEIYLFAQKGLNNLKLSSKFFLVRGSLDRYGSDIYQDRKEKSEALLVDSMQLLSKLGVNSKFIKHTEYERHTWYLIKNLNM